MIALLFVMSLLGQMPLSGLSSAPFGIAERAAGGFVSVQTRLPPATQFALAN